ncbi:MAG: LysM peptidoglycan-binding domain-containing M23 family metallopeptidase [Xenococcaceae cyanobacterium MO_167.B27]|nr:LysM peptidoglycan-binding domain-containing M23 family metallopeptidase [Xenococcaceae cyanobacterium MO_167.B27]
MQHPLLSKYTLNLSPLMTKLAISASILGTFILSQPVQAITEPSESKITQVTIIESDRRTSLGESNSWDRVLISQSISIPTLASLETTSVTKVPKNISTVVSSSQEDNELSTRRILIQSNLNPDETRSIAELPVLGNPPENQSPPEKPQQIHRVQAGETIFSIARKYGISSLSLIRANKISNANRIDVDDQLIVPLKDSEITPQPQNISNANLGNNSISILGSEDTVIQGVRSRSSDIEFQPLEDNATNPYITRLRADIVKLRTQYQGEVRETTANSEEIATELTNNPESEPVIATSSLTDSRVAPTSANDYDEILQLSLANPITPELPPLSSHEKYLPNYLPNILPNRSNNSFNGYIWPARGTFTSGFGWRWGRMHKGIDIAAPIGTPILAAASGEVISAGWNRGGFGNLVKIRHSNGSVTLYAHNNRIYVRRGQRVKQGQQIAEMGSTGFSTGPHLHFEIRPNGRHSVNPMAHLPRKRK